MALAELRDLVIVIFAIVVILATLLFVSLAIMLFRKVSSLLDSAKSISANIRGTTSSVSNTIIKPAIKLASFASGIRKTTESMMWLFRRKGGEKGEQQR